MSINPFYAVTREQEIQAWVLAPQNMNHVTLGKSLCLSEPQFTHLQNQGIMALDSLKFLCSWI